MKDVNLHTTRISSLTKNCSQKKSSAQVVAILTEQTRLVDNHAVRLAQALAVSTHQVPRDVTADVTGAAVVQAHVKRRCRKTDRNTRHNRHESAVHTRQNNKGYTLHKRHVTAIKLKETSHLYYGKPN